MPEVFTPDEAEAIQFRQTAVFTPDEADQNEILGRQQIGFQQSRLPREFGWAEYGVEKLPFMGSIVKTAKQLEAYRAAKRVTHGAGTKQDFDFLREYTSREKYQSERDWLAYTADLAASVPGFAIEFLASAGAYSGTKAGVAALGEKAIGKAAEKGIGKLAVGTTARAAGSIAQTAAMPQLIAESVTRRLVPEMGISEDDTGNLRSVIEMQDEGFAESLGKGALDALIEIASERTGGVVERLPFLKGLKGAVGRRFLARGKTVQALAETVQRAGWNGVLGEVFEERVGEVARGATGVEKNYGVSGRLALDPLDPEAWKQLASEGVAFSLFGGAVATPGLVAKVAERVAGGGAPSRSEAKELGIPDAEAKSAQSRRAWFEQNRNALEEAARERAGESEGTPGFGRKEILPAGQPASGPLETPAIEPGAGSAGPAVVPPTTPPPAPAQPPAPAPEPEGPAGAASESPPAVRLARRVLAHLRGNDYTIDKDTLFRMADEEWGGARAQGTYSHADAYEALELALNMHALLPAARRGTADAIPATPGAAKGVVQSLQALRGKAFAETVRDEEKVASQQFSTPPDYAFAAVYAANINPGDVAVEPSAGTGSLVVPMANQGAIVYANDFSPRRIEALRELQQEHAVRDVGSYDAEFIAAMHTGPAPSVVVMNPPFSRSAQRTGNKRIIGMDRRHVDSALELLQPGGRLVAIMGAPMRGTEDGQKFKKWLKKVARDYNVLANVHVSREVYRGYGTTFPTRLLVVDKPAPGETSQGSHPETQHAESVTALIDLLQEVRDARKSRPGLPGPPQGPGVLPQPASSTGGGTGGVGGGGIPGLGAPPNVGPGGPAGPSVGPPGPGGPTGGGPTGGAPGGTAGRGRTGTGVKTPPTGAGPGGGPAPGERVGGKGAGGGSAPDITQMTPEEVEQWVLDQSAKDSAAANPPIQTSPVPEPPPGKSTGTKAPTLRDKADVAKVKYEQAKADFKSYLDGMAFSTPLDPKLIGLAAKLGRYAVEAKIYSFAAWIEDLARDFGPERVLKLSEVLESTWNILKRADPRGVLSPTGKVADVLAKVAPATVASEKAGKAKLSGEKLFEEYQPSRKWQGAAKHLGTLVESSSMAVVDHPEITYELALPAEAVSFLSNEQLVQIALGCQANEQMLPSRLHGGKSVAFRRGYLNGDGTGVGKSAELLGVILENRARGRKKAVLLTKSVDLISQLKRDWEKMGQDPELIFSLPEKNNLPVETGEGILVVAYSTLHRTHRSEQVVDWIGKDSDGVVACDEIHSASNLGGTKAGRGKSKGSEQARAVYDLQMTLPNARFQYASATAASEIQDLKICDRLGLWGPGTEFDSATDFVNSMAEGRVAAMECIAQSMKAQGAYLSRGITFDDGTELGTVKLEPLLHQMSPEQHAIYNRIAEAWMIAHDAFNTAIKTTKKGRWDTSHFFGAQLRFFQTLVTSTKIPSVIRQIEEDLASDPERAVVIQITETGESALNRAINALPEGTDPAEAQPSIMLDLIDMVERSFPTQEYVDEIDDQGNVHTVPLVYPEGHPQAGQPVLNPKAVAARDALIADLESIESPTSALDQIIHYFGHEAVAEVTGRKRRIVLVEGVRKIQDLPGAFAMGELQGFKDGKKRIVVFSDKGGTGFDFHAGRDMVNQARRVHYVLQAGYSAKMAIQKLGRTHRTNQVSAPIVRICGIELPGEKRFTATICRRIAQLGALVKGQRNASSNYYSDSDNLECLEARQAYNHLVTDIGIGGVEGMTLKDLEEMTHLSFLDKDGKIKASVTDNISQLLNRILAMKIEDQHRIFNLFAERLAAIVEQKRAAGTLDTGLENIRAEKIERISERVIYEKENVQVKHVKLLTYHDNRRRTMQEVELLLGPRKIGFYRNVASAKVYGFAGSDLNDTDPVTGQVINKVRRLGIPQTSADYVPRSDLADKYEELTHAEALKVWREQFETTPTLRKETVHLISGALLPIWKKIPGHPKLERAAISETDHVLGRRVKQRELATLYLRLGIRLEGPKLSPREMVERLTNGTVILHLSNGWRIRQATRADENRILIEGPSFASTEKLRTAGAFTERFGKPEWFIPTGDRALEVLENVLEISPVSKAEVLESEGDQGLGKGGKAGHPRKHGMPVTMQGGTGEKIGARDVLEGLEKYFGVPLRAGHMRRGRLRGVWRKTWGAARTPSDESASIDVGTHEIAHGIDATTDIRKAATSAARAELRTLDYDYPKKKRASEGFAEFVRGYLTEDFDVKQEAKVYYGEFMDWLGKNPKWEKAFADAKSLINRFRAAGALGRVAGQISHGERPRLPVREWLPWFFQSGYQKMKDIAYYGFLFEKELRSRGYKPEKGGSFMDTYRAWTQGGPCLANTALENGVFTLGGKKVKQLCPSLWDALEKIKKQDYDTWALFAYCRHAIESWSKDLPPGITLADAEAVYNEHKHKTEWIEAADRVTEFNNALVVMLAESGVISAETATRIIKAYKTYLPLYRMIPDKLSSGVIKGVRLIDLPDPIKRRRGSGYKVIDPIQSTIQRAILFYERAAAQVVTTEMVRAAMKHGANGWIERLPPNLQVTAVSVGEVWPTIRNSMLDAGMTDPEIEAIEDTLDTASKGQWQADLVNVWRPNYWDQSGRPVARIMFEGKPTLFYIQPDLYRTIGGLGLFQLPKLLDMTLGRMTRMVRMGATTLNLTFIPTNFARDMSTYLVQREYGGPLDPFKWVVAYAYSETMRRLGATEHPMVKLWRQYGGQLSSVLGHDRASVRRAVASAVAGRQRFGVMETITDAMQVTEAGPRLAEFAAVWKKHGYKKADVARMVEQGEVPTEILREALNAAHEVTVDFRRHGEWGRWLSRGIPFFNARLEGTDKFVRTVKNRPVASFVRIMGYSVLPSIVYWFIHRDDDWYKERESWLDTYWVITDDDGNPVGRIPRGHELSQVGAGVEAILDRIYRDNPDAIKRWAGSALKQTRPGLNVSGVGVALELALNKKFFQGKPIVGRSLQALEPRDQSYEYNTAIVKTIGTWLNVSPAKLEHAIDSISGGMYRRYVSPVDKWWKGDPLTPGDIPVVQGFTLRQDYGRSEDDFYAEQESLSKRYKSAQLLAQGPSIELRRAYSRMGKISDLMAELRNLGNGAPEKKRAEITRYVTGLARFALERPPLDRYPNPLAAPEVPGNIKLVRDAHLASTAFSVARYLDPIDNDDTQRIVDNGVAYLKELGLPTKDLLDLLEARLRADAKKQGRKLQSDTIPAARGRLKKRLGL